MGAFGFLGSWIAEWELFRMRISEGGGGTNVTLLPCADEDYFSFCRSIESPSKGCPDTMSTLKPDIQEEDSDYRSAKTLPGDVAEVAVASVMFEMIGARERYWLSPSGDGESRYELWSEADLRKGCFTCCVWLEDCEGLAASFAAEQLLEALWMRRPPIALSLISFKEAGLVAMERLKKLLSNYDRRLRPTKAPKLAWTLRGELHRED